MRASTRCIEFIEEFESFEPHAYYATDEERRRGIATIGYGSTYYKDGSPVNIGDSISKEEAKDLAIHWINSFSAKVDSLITEALEQHEFDACVSLAYNIGIGNFRNSTLLRLINDGIDNKKEEAKQFLRWDRQANQRLRGLTRRRGEEMQMFENGDYTID